MKLGEKLKASGPAWMAAGLNIGGATVTNSVILAAATGYLYGWVFAIATLSAFFATYSCVRLTIVSNQNPIALIKKEINPTFGWIVGIAVLLSNIIFFTIQVSLLGDIVNTLLPGITFKIWMIVAIVAAAILILIPGKSANEMLQKIIKWMVYLLTVSYIISLFVIDVDWIQFYKGITGFTLPTNKTEVLLFTSVLGSAMAINVPFLQAYATKSSKYGIEKLGLFKFETIITNIFLLFVQLAVLIVVTTTLYASQITPKSAIDAAVALEPIAGKLSTILFSLGMLGAALSTMIANTSIQAYIMTDLLDWETNPGTKRFKTIQLIMLIIALSIPVLGWNAYSVASWGGAFNSLFMPIGILAWLILNNKKELIGNYRPSMLINLGIGLSLTIGTLSALRFIYVNFL